MIFKNVENLIERNQAVDLAKAVFKPNMEEQFPLLFGESNWNHMFIAIEEGIVVSMVNYYPSKILIHGAQIHVASVGAVCTHPGFRNRKLASSLLKLAENQMQVEGVQIMIISGSGGIYSNIGASLAGNVYEYMLDSSNFIDTDDFELKTNTTECFDCLKSIYELEKVRFLRSDYEFKKMLKGQTYPDSFATYPIYMIKGKKQAEAYVIGVLPIEGDEFGLKEFGGNRKAIIACFNKMIKKHQRLKIHFAADINDPIIPLLHDFYPKKIHQHASFKIINFISLMQSLKPYFTQRAPDTSIEFNSNENEVIFKAGREIYVVSNPQLLSQLVLGFDQEVNFNLDGVPTIKSFIEAVFPIPFVWTHNLNYQ